MPGDAFSCAGSARESDLPPSVSLQYRSHGGAGREGLRRLCRGYSEYLLRNQGLIRLLVENHIDYLLYDTFFEALDECDCFLGSADPCTRRYAVSFYAGGVASVARRYAQEDCAATAEQLEGLLMTLFTGGMFR